MNTIFEICGPIMLAGWVALLVTPIAPKIMLGIATYISPIVLSIIYTGLILVYFADAQGGFDSFENVKLLFTQDEMIMAGWVHYLAFDLFVGAWIVTKSREWSMPHLLIVPCLPITLLFGPAGYLMFLGVRLAYMTYSSRNIANEVTA